MQKAFPAHPEILQRAYSNTNQHSPIALIKPFSKSLSLSRCEYTNGSTFRYRDRCHDTLQYLQSKSLSLSAIFITHQHRDHIWALNQFTEAYPDADIYSSQASNDSRYSFNLIKANNPQKFGSFEIEAYETTGHTEDGMSFKVTGLF